MMPTKSRALLIERGAGIMDESEHRFEGTADPGKVTSEDMARWCEDLGQAIRDNPLEPSWWLPKASRLYSKLRAAAFLIGALPRAVD